MTKINTSTKATCAQCKRERMIPAHRKVCSGCRTFNLHVKNGEVLPPTTEGLMTDGYKEPMQPVQDGFGFYGALTRSSDEMMVQCHICGFLFQHLTAHVRMAHGINGREYRTKFGLRLGDGLVGRGERERLQKIYGDVLRSHALTNLAKAHEAAKAKMREGWKPGGDVWTQQLRNERGLCKAQTIAKLQHVGELNDGVVSQRLFRQLYGKDHVSVVEHWFGTWAKGVQAAGCVSAQEHNRVLRREQIDSAIEQTLENMQLFYEQFGRTPQTADFNSENSLPPLRWISRHFGGVNKARRAAGVPIMVNVGNGHWRESLEYLDE